ncbi:MAG: hypothetical protein N2449_06375 [Bacteroidales bacterium]|nr:hypothetical protein [Bacteroidales bacterium]
MKNNFLRFLFFILVLTILSCRTTPPHQVKIIEEKDPLVKTIEEKDSMRIVTDTIKNVSRKK